MSKENEEVNKASEKRNLPKPIRIIWETIKSFINGAINVFKSKNKKGIIFASVITAFWVIMYIFELAGIYNPILSMLSFLTASRAGLIGKLAFISVIITFFKGSYKDFFESCKFGFDDFKKIFFSKHSKLSNILKEKNSLGIILSGIGSAFIIHLLVMDGGGLSSILVGVSCILLVFRAFEDEECFIKKLVVSIFEENKENNRFVNEKKVNYLLSGLILGFSLSLFLSIWINSLYLIILSVIIFTIGLVFWKQGGVFESKPKEEKIENTNEEKDKEDKIGE